MFAHAKRGVPALAAVALAALPLAACKGKGNDGGSDTKYEPPPRQAYSVGSYAELCSAEDTTKSAFPAAPKYERKKAASDLSKVVVFRKYMDDPKATFQELTPEGLKGFLAEDPKQVELVACVEVKKLKFMSKSSTLPP